jgi:hypothetical protein
MSTRNTWFRIVLVLTVLLTVNLAVYGFNLPFNRTDAISSFRGILILLSISTALTIAIFTSFIKGTKEKFVQNIDDVRELLESIVDEIAGRKEECFNSLLEKFVVPLSELHTNDWLNSDNTDGPFNELEEYFDELIISGPNLIYNQLASIDRKRYDIFVSMVRLVKNGIYLENLKGTFLLVICTGVASGFLFLMPHTDIGNFLVLNLITMLVMFSLIELYFIFTWLYQEGKEELIDEDFNGKEEVLYEASADKEEPLDEASYK